MTRGHLYRNIKRILDLNCCVDPERVAEEIIIEFEVATKIHFSPEPEVQAEVIPLHKK